MCEDAPPGELSQQLERLTVKLESAERRLAGLQAEKEAEAARWHRLVAIVEGSRDAIWSWDLQGTIDSWNGEAERMFQYRADEIIGRSLFVLVPPERMDRARAAFTDLLGGKWYDQYETVRVRKDGSRVPVELTVSPVKDAGGTMVGVATICRDISGRLRQEEALRASEARYRSAAITGRIGAWETDMQKRIRTWTAEGMELFGLRLPDGRGQVGGPEDEFWNALHPDDRHLMKQFHRTADQVDTYPCEYRIVRPDGKTLWVSGRGRVVARSADGKAQLVANMVMDITDRKNAEHQVQLLLRESTHRAKNLLAVVQAVATQTGRASATLEEFQERFGERLRALAGVQDLLVQGDWRGAELGDLIRGQLSPFVERGVGLNCEGTGVELSASLSQTLGLALHELGTNATKYGAWSSPGGQVSITWDLIETGDQPELHLTWTEAGGPVVEVPLRKGFGHIVFERMVEQSSGGEVKIDYDPAGLRWSVLLPIDPAN